MTRLRELEEENPYEGGRLDVLYYGNREDGLQGYTVGPFSYLHLLGRRAEGLVGATNCRRRDGHSLGCGWQMFLFRLPDWLIEMKGMSGSSTPWSTGLPHRTWNRPPLLPFLWHKKNKLKRRKPPGDLPKAVNG